uniref:G protein-coupled receptor n=1 Tax=Steinernema glaseri TaxID=37863 RepID=A0A1I8ATW6_9BILA
MSTSQCALGQLFASNTSYRVLSYYHIVLCLLGTASIFIIVKIQRNKFSLHRNVKVILGLHLLYSFTQSFGFVAVHIADLIRLSPKHDDPCDYLLPAAYVFNFRQVPVLGIYGQIVTIACISVERTFASVLKHYEKRQFTLLVVMLGVGQFIFIIGAFYVFLAVDVDWTSKVAAFNVKETYHQEQQLVWLTHIVNHIFAPSNFILRHTELSRTFVVFLGAGIELLSIISFHILLFVNKRRRDQLRNESTSLSLSDRYQVAENVNVMNLLLPAVWTHFLVYGTSCVTLMLLDHIVDQTDKVATATFLDAANILSYYPIFIAIFMFKKYAKTRRNLFNAADVNGRVQPKKNEGDVHFEYLKAMVFEKPIQNRITFSMKYVCCS